MSTLNTDQARGRGHGCTLEDLELRREGESEASYLKRLRLLLPGEKQPKEDLGPKRVECMSCCRF